MLPLTERTLCEAIVLVHDLIDSPENFSNHYKRFAASVVFSTVFNCRISSPDDMVLQEIAQANANFLQAFRPEGYLIDRYPILRHLPTPLSPWKRTGKKWFEHEFGIYNRYYQTVLRQVKEGTAAPCIARDVIENREASGLTHREAAYTTGSMIGAGSDSTAMTLSCFTMAACLYPEVARRAQQEIDAVVGQDQLPTVAHLDQLPYCQALVQEVLRWRPFAPGGTPHYAQKADTYRGWHVPKGTTVMANLWSIHNDERFWDRPQDFNPERHLDSHAKAGWPSSRRVFTFGFGRRICPGRQLAMQSLSLSTIVLLWAFDFGHALDANGSKVDIDPDAFQDGLASPPLPFRCKITARSDRVVSHIEQQYADLDWNR